MKYVMTLLVAMVVSAGSLAQAIPDNLYAKPVANSDINGHEWSYKGGMDFDTLRYFQASSNDGVTFYLGVEPGSTVDISPDAIQASLFGKPVILYQNCDSAGQCSFNNIVDTGMVIKGQPIWIHVWVKSQKATLKSYLTWLASVKFVDNTAK